MNAYVQHLRLKHDPFADAIERDDFYGGGNRDNLVYTVLDRERPAVSLDAVIGPSGGGKTRLASRLCECAPIHELPALVAVDLFTTDTQLLGAILRELGINPPSEPGGGLDSLSEHTINLNRDGKSILLLIDNAHELGPGCLRLVERLLANRWSALHLVLLGEDQLADMLQARLRERYRAGLAIHQLKPLNRVETAEYIHLKLARAGNDRKLSMTSQAALDMLQQCGGLPGKINALTAAMLDRQAQANAGHASRGPHAARRRPPPRGAQTKPAQQVERPEIHYLWQAFALSIVLAVVVLWPVETPESSASPPPPAQAQRIALPASAGPPSAATASAANRTGSGAAVGGNEFPTLSRFELLLLDTPADHFTVQLVGASSEESVLEFIASAQLGGVHGYYETRQGRDPWFVVVDGVYSDWEAAMEARSRLARSFGENGPWIRRVSNVHAEIARSGKRGGP